LNSGRITVVQYSADFAWKREYNMLGKGRSTPDDDVRPASQRTGNDGVHPIGEVLAELLDQYRAKFPEIKVMVVEKPSAAR
jgi:hypothetical protein